MKLTTRVVATLAATTITAAGVTVAAASAATAVPVCVTDGISREVGPDGVPLFRNNADCGPVYEYERPPLVHPEPVTPVPLPSDNCLTGLAGDIACDRSREDWTVPHPIWFQSPGGLPQVTGYEYPDGTVTVGEPETVPSGGGGGGGWSGGGGGVFIGGGSSGGGGGGTVTVGEPENADTQAE